ncbi:MAG: hypothetical protein LLF86_04770 [Nitrospiraceae bacterium]|nr:hypothetical protein [Nitrospiraceae bacterium]
MRSRNSGKFSFFLKTLSVVLLLASVFSIVWLRSSVVSMEYRLGKLENTKMEMLKERKHLDAQRASLMSVERLGKAAAREYVFPDRVKVVYVKKDPGQQTHKTAVSSKSGDNRNNLLGMVRD